MSHLINEFNMIYALKVKGSSPKILSVSLKEVLDCVSNSENIQWSILWLTAVGNLEPESVIAIEERANQSANGLEVSWPFLLEFAEKVSQIIEIILLGNTSPEQLHRYENDNEMYSSCDYILELIDSSYWLLHSKNAEFIMTAKKKLQGSEIIT